MTIKHTLAPWQLTFGEHDAAIHAGATIAMVDDTMGGWKANARLIAAAPDMLHALRLMLREHDALQMAAGSTEDRWPAATLARSILIRLGDE